MQVREVIRIIENDGWFLIRQKGSYKQYKHPVKQGLVTIAAHRLSDGMALLKEHCIAFSNRLRYKLKLDEKIFDYNRKN